MPHSNKPVFLDPERNRWRRLRTLLDISGATITIVVLVFLFSVWQNENLPSIFLPRTKRTYRALTDNEKKALIQKHTKRPVRQKTSTGTFGMDGRGQRSAFYVAWDAAAFSSLKEYHSQIDLLFAEWLHVLTPDGHLQGLTTSNEHFPAIVNGKAVQLDDKVMPFLHSVKAETAVLPLINNYDSVTNVWDPNIGKFLNNQAARANFISQARLVLSADKFAGLSLDLEEIPLWAQTGFNSLVSELYDELHPRGLKLFLNVPVDDDNFNYRFLAAHSDGLVLMNYDQHQTESQPGPIAGQEWFIRNMELALRDIPKEKIVFAIGNYGYDWTTRLPGPGHPKPLFGGGHAITAQDAWLSAHDSETFIDFDGMELNPHFSYVENGDMRHDVWYLNAITALNQMRAANSLGIDNFALWRLGSEDRSIWPIWDAPSAENAPEKLTKMPPGQDVDYNGNGEILRIVGKPVEGERKVSIDKDTGYIDETESIRLPQPFQIERYGYAKKKIALTFDDGPDPKFTPLVLEALKKENIKSAFFIIGVQAEKEPGLVKRVYDEGHEIGNHTWTHPDISNISDRYMALELNLTERFFASKLGIKPLYFRPPYGIDQEPDIADQVEPLEVVQQRGYYTIGNNIDPNDWKDSPHNTAQEITNSVMVRLQQMEEALDGKIPTTTINQPASIVLLHDGGGDRTETVKAIPLLAKALRARGYEIVPVYELLGKTRDQVMPAISSDERMTARIDNVAFSLFFVILNFIAAVFFFGDVLMTGRLTLIGFAAILDRLQDHADDAKLDRSYKPRIAVLVPAFNEELVIERTVRSVLASDYTDIHVIVIDDGSSDKTLEVARRAFAKEIAAGKVTVITQANGGKATALNHGLKYVKEEVFVAIDADTNIDRKAISYLVPHFSNPKIGALAGNAKVGNRVNLWTRWQALEYITSQNFERRALNTLGAVSVVPGAIGAWRTAAVRELGGYSTITVAEDADLTMSLLRAGYRVEYEDRALAFTEAPMDANGLMRQRFRWSFGILQSVFKHRAAIWRGGKLGWIAIPNIIVFQIMLPLVSPFIDIMFAFGFISYFFERHYHPDTSSINGLVKLSLYFVIFLLVDFLTSLLAFILERKEARQVHDKWLLTQVWLQRFAYRQLFSIVLFRTLKRAVDGRPFAWDKLERTASVTQR